MSDSGPAPAPTAAAWVSDPNTARMYDYYLGGKDNYQADREAAERAMAAAPVIPVLARANRAFLVAAVSMMAEAGVGQYLDIGSGLPTSPNVHEVARERVPGARVVYVDVDPVVVSHSRALRADDGTAAVRADMRFPPSVLMAPEVKALIDFKRPCGLLFISALHFVSGNIAPLMAEYTRRLAPGSFMALSHVAADGADQDRVSGVVEAYRRTPTDSQVRSAAEITGLFDGFEILHPGLTDVRTYTDPAFEFAPGRPAPVVWMLCAVGRKE